MFQLLVSFLFFFFNDTATTEIYTLSLHDALPISIILILIGIAAGNYSRSVLRSREAVLKQDLQEIDRKSTRLNSSHVRISYAVFCLKKKTQTCEVCDSAPVDR